ncbi:MAG TPA: DUF559 domain-containing protein [Candidatus Thiothrix moscowensis]|uniref:endonuclease domain-containing protein n=1 Tax=Thiothrix sp. UBA2332 TaxID=1947696 RepID=UPI0025DC83D7|nr:DUF559 domain-containing protein [Thiothrix sp. UBA2332]HRJ54583.1 DUF559 domain-containing protein [Candidatus Thiothrix moscowensis]HRJ94965.1 DUF559 domain-containing protein [Candidatus Thiothrix moscowensis]
MQENYHYHHRQLARTLRKQATPAEQHLWRYLRKQQLAGFRFRRQAAIGRYIVDFVCFEKKLIIELDGEIHLEQIAYDQIRDEWLSNQGFRVLRFRNQQILTQTETTLSQILKALEETT